MPPPTSLRDAFKDHSRLRDLVIAGMGAFERQDVRLVAEGQRPQIGESLDLDEAAREEYPQANRWDYVGWHSGASQIFGIEPHSAKDSEVSVVIAKKNQATVYLRNHLKNGQKVHKWFWVSHGTVSLSRMDKARRRLDQNGITFAGREIRTFG